jgi:hypothetical protein
LLRRCGLSWSDFPCWRIFLVGQRAHRLKERRSAACQWGRGDCL